MKSRTSTILVVGFRDQNTASALSLLEREGCTVLQSRSPFEAVELLRERPIEILVIHGHVEGLTPGELIRVVEKHGSVGHYIIAGEGRPTSEPVHGASWQRNVHVVAFEHEQLAAGPLMEKVRELLPPLDREQRAQGDDAPGPLSGAAGANNPHLD